MCVLLVPALPDNIKSCNMAGMDISQEVTAAVGVLDEIWHQTSPRGSGELAGLTSSPDSKHPHQHRNTATAALSLAICHMLRRGSRTATYFEKLLLVKRRATRAVATQAKLDV